MPKRSRQSCLTHVKEKRKTAIDNDVTTITNSTASVVVAVAPSVAVSPTVPSNDKSCLSINSDEDNKQSSNPMYYIGDSDDESVISCSDKQTYKVEHTQRILNAEYSRRMAIAHVFVFNYDAIDEEYWEEVDMVNQIKAMFKDIHPRTDIKPILRDVLHCKNEGKLYDGTTNRFKSGHKPIVKIDSLEAQMFADVLEQTHSMQITLSTINAHYQELEKSVLSMSVL